MQKYFPFGFPLQVKYMLNHRIADISLIMYHLGSLKSISFVSNCRCGHFTANEKKLCVRKVQQKQSFSPSLIETPCKEKEILCFFLLASKML